MRRAMLATVLSLALAATPPPTLLDRIEDPTTAASDRASALDGYEAAAALDRSQSIVLTFDLAVTGARAGELEREGVSAMLRLVVRPEAWMAPPPRPRCPDVPLPKPSPFHRLALRAQAARLAIWRGAKP